MLLLVVHIFHLSAGLQLLKHPWLNYFNKIIYFIPSLGLYFEYFSVYFYYIQIHKKIWSQGKSWAIHTSGISTCPVWISNSYCKSVFLVVLQMRQRAGGRETQLPGHHAFSKPSEMGKKSIKLHQGKRVHDGVMSAYQSQVEPVLSA